MAHAIPRGALWNQRLVYRASPCDASPRVTLLLVYRCGPCDASSPT